MSKLEWQYVDRNYLVGKIIEVNYSNSRALLLSDLNSKIPVLLEPIVFTPYDLGLVKIMELLSIHKDEYEEKSNMKKLLFILLVMVVYLNLVSSR